MLESNKFFNFVRISSYLIPPMKKRCCF